MPRRPSPLHHSGRWRRWTAYAAAGVSVSLSLAAGALAQVAHRPPSRPAASRSAPSKPAASTLALVPLWTITLAAPPAGSPAYDNDHAYVPLRGGRLVAVSLSDGAIRWSVDRLVTTAPASGEGMVIVASEGAIVALAAETGSAVWRVPLDGAPAAPLLCDGGWLMAATAGGEVVAFRARDGATVWRHTTGVPVVELPALAGDRAFLSLKDGRVVALDLPTGRQVWEQKLGGPPGRILPLNDRLFVGSEDKYFYCLDTRNGKRKWRWRTGGHGAGTPSVDEKRVYFLSLDNQLRALDRGNGHQVWRTSLPVRALAGPLRVDDLLLVSGISAEVRAYHAEDGTAAGELAAPEELVAPPHLVANAGGTGSRLVVLTGGGQVQLLGPAPPKLPQWIPWVWWD